MFNRLVRVALAGVLLLIGKATAQPADDTIEKRPRLGFVLVAWDDQYNANPRAWERSVQQLFDAGIRNVTVVTYRFVDRSVGKISVLSSFGLETPPSNAVVLAALKKAQQLGMRASLNPLLEIDNPDDLGSQWRGDLDFTGKPLGSFFTNYRAYVEEMAQIVKAAGAHRLYVGSELKSLAINRDARPLWSGLIRDVRPLVPPLAKLSYASNYDNAGSVPFWSELDEIGIDAYFELATESEATGKGNPQPSVIKEGWKAPLDEMRKLSHKYERPVVFSEWGVVPFDRTTVGPWDWMPTQRKDPQEQFNAYQGTLEAVASEGSWLTEINFWHWAMPGNQGSHYRIAADSKILRLITQSAGHP